MHKILIVEDHKDFRDLLKRMLCDRFPEMLIAEASDATTALNQVGLIKPDSVLIDINLRGNTNGLELTERIRRAHPACKIAIMTSHDLPEYREASMRLGADRFLPKSSSTASDIVNTVEQFVQA